MSCASLYAAKLAYTMFVCTRTVDAVKCVVAGRSAAPCGTIGVWAFRAKPMPILQEMGIEAKATIEEIDNIIDGQ